MKTFLSTVALAALFVPSVALAQPGAQDSGPQRFSRGGHTYVYTVSPAAGGRQVIQGRRLPSGSAFRLVVNGDRVDGMSGGHPVSFRTPQVKAQMASR